MGLRYVLACEGSPKSRTTRVDPSTYHNPSQKKLWSEFTSNLFCFARLTGSKKGVVAVCFTTCEASRPLWYAYCVTLPIGDPEQEGLLFFAPYYYLLPPLCKLLAPCHRHFCPSLIVSKATLPAVSTAQARADRAKQGRNKQTNC